MNLDNRLIIQSLLKRATDDMIDFSNSVNERTDTLDELNKNSLHFRRKKELLDFVIYAEIEINETEKELSFKFITENRTEEFSIIQLDQIKQDYEMLCLDKTLEYLISERLFKYLK